MVRLRRREITPALGDSISAINLNSVDLPLPFSPTRPIRSPSSSSRPISEKTGLPPKSLLTSENVISNMGMCLLIGCNDMKRSGKEGDARRQMAMHKERSAEQVWQRGKSSTNGTNNTDTCSNRVSKQLHWVGATFRRISKCARLMRRYHARCVYKGIDDPKGKLLLCHTGDGMHVHIAWVNGTIACRGMSRQN